MTLNTAQFAQLIENYVSHIVNEMDTESMKVTVTDLLIREYDNYTEEDIISEIDELYGEEVVAELIESVTDVS